MIHHRHGRHYKARVTGFRFGLENLKAQAWSGPSEAPAAALAGQESAQAGTVRACVQLLSRWHNFSCPVEKRTQVRLDRREWRGIETFCGFTQGLEFFAAVLFPLLWFANGLRKF